MNAPLSNVRPSKTALNMVLAAALLLAGGLPAHAELPPTQIQGSTEYVSGGFGQDESTSMKQAMNQWPLALTFASQVDGKAAYAGEVQVVIRNTSDATVLNVTSDGPYFLARLDPGSYRLFVTYDNQTQSKTITIAASKTTRATFIWNRPATGPD
ncbi:MAG: carboxypeptidase-like regulatory domain-containing protein [Burkholderiaceae bacterium]